MSAAVQCSSWAVLDRTEEFIIFVVDTSDDDNFLTAMQLLVPACETAEWYWAEVGLNAHGWMIHRLDRQVTNT